MSINDYYSNVSAPRQDRLKEIDKLIRITFPQAVPSLRYKMPTFESTNGWIAFASQKNHISVYTCSPEKLSPYLEIHPKTNHGKGCLRFPDNTPIDMKALKQLIIKALA